MGGIRSPRPRFNLDRDGLGSRVTGADGFNDQDVLRKLQAMTRRQRHNRVLAGVTVVLFAVCGHLMLTRGDLKGCLLAGGVYTLFLLLFGLACRLEIPKRLRRPPDRPAEFTVFRLGPISDHAAVVLDEARVVKERAFGSKTHRLLRLERRCPEGTWSCEIEVADNHVVAMATSFESHVSPVMDRGDQIGRGRFLPI